MQIIQNIREKGTSIVIIVIALSLIGFILMDAKSGSNSSLFGGNSTSVGKINSTSVDLVAFNKRVTDEENKQAAQRGGQQPSGAEAMSIRENVWNQTIAEVVFYKEADKLGIALTPKEFSSILMSNDPQNPLTQERDLLDPNTGQLDVTKVQARISEIKKAKGDQRDYVDSRYVEPLKLTTAAQKYGALISASAYYPTWMQQKDMSELKNYATIQYVAVPYAAISDSAVIVKDEDINAYTSTHKDLFKQEAGRTISYITFSQLPSLADSALVKKSVEDLKANFLADTSAEKYVARNSTTIPFVNEFLPLSKITSEAKDTLLKLPVGTVYGPYVDGQNFALAKILGVKQLPDSVKARHILISLNDTKTGAPVRADSAAKQLADSILIAVKSGADFAGLAAKYSADANSVPKGGDLGPLTFGTSLPPELNEFAFGKVAGEKAVVKTQYGYHVIDIVSQSNFKPALKVAYLAKTINPSDETINAASIAATKAAAQKSGKELAEYAQKNGLRITDLPLTIKENDFTVANMQDARSLVRWVFEAKKGAVSDPIIVGSDFVVATVNKIYSEGVQDAETARVGAEAIVRNQKKAAIITAKLGATLESASAAYNNPINTAGADSTITLAGRIINGIGNEPKVIGASFNKENQTKVSTPIIGNTGVYVIKVSSIQALPAPTADETEAQVTSHTATIRGLTNQWFEGLRKQATIKDNRSKFF